MKLKSFLTQAASVLRRLDQLLPPEPCKPDWQAIAFRWQKHGNGGLLTALPRPHTLPLARLCAVSPQTQRLVRNTEQFLAGRPANNALLTGARGTGKLWGGGYFCTGMTGGKKRRKTLSGADLSEAGARKNLHQLLL